MTTMPKDMPKLDEILIKADAMPWREKSLKGVHEKMLWRNDETGASIALIRFEKGAGIPQPHYHASNQFMFCLQGRYEYTPTNVVLTPPRGRTTRAAARARACARDSGHWLWPRSCRRAR